MYLCGQGKTDAIKKGLTCSPFTLIKMHVSRACLYASSDIVPRDSFALMGLIAVLPRGQVLFRR